MVPFLKWAGGKRWLTSSKIIPDKQDYNKYFEPFLGSGAVFFHSEPDQGILSDVNAELINSYIVLRDNWLELSQLLYEYQGLHNKDFYYEMREFRPENALINAARFIYLNRTCWNGLYRVNRKGEFNVPIGTKSNVILEVDNFKGISELLNRVEIYHCDFEKTIDKAEIGDFVFIDPPYTVKHNLNGFVKYNEPIFSWEDQIRLRNCVKQAIDRGAYVLILNANHDSIKTLYNNLGQFIFFDRASVIAGKANARGKFSELAIKCW